MMTQVTGAGHLGDSVGDRRRTAGQQQTAQANKTFLHDDTSLCE